MKRLILIILSIAGCVASMFAAQSQWRQYCSFDNPMQRVIDTPDYVYFTVYGQPVVPNVTAMAQPKLMLYRYDKSGDELQAVNSMNDLKANIVNQVHYNAAKKYLMVVYNDYDIDLLFDNGNIINIPELRLADNIRGSRSVNNVFFYPEQNKIYLAADFGMVEIDDSRGVVVNSRSYPTPLTAIGRLGDTLLLSTATTTYKTLADASNFTLTEMNRIDGLSAVRKYSPVSGNRLLVVSGPEASSTIAYMSETGDGLKVSDVAKENVTAIETTRDGVMLKTPAKAMFMGGKNDTSVTLQSDDASYPAGCWDGTEFWFARPRAGFYSKKAENGAWTLTRDAMMPNSPAVFIATDMLYNSRYGMLLCNYGYCRNFNSSAREGRVPILISGLKDGHWTNYGPTYDDITATAEFWNPLGITQDPENNDRLWFGSAFRGILRVDLEDPSTLLHLSYPKDPTASSPGFVNFVPTQVIWPESCAFTRPEIDANGVMWTSHYNNDYPEQLELWHWTREDRVASESPSTFRPWKTRIIENIKSFPSSFLLPCKTSANKNILIFVVNDYNAPVLFIDTAGTPDIDSDDTIVNMTSFIDSDGEAIKPLFFFDVQEDPTTGLVWFASQVGVFTANPRKVVDGEVRVNRIKVARNDGTNLADYLFHNVQVNKICFTPDRIWFGTSGGGLVCTTRSGNEIVAEYTTANSGIPGDIVYGVGYNPDSNSIMVSTDQGLGELYLESVGLGENLDNVRAYPNPVRPDYYGFVTIDGLVGESMVKIVDSAGNLVRELGPAENGIVEWDVTNLRYEGVKSGVYYVLASSGPGDDTNYTKVTKILVIR